jgi:hypothetical protein
MMNGVPMILIGSELVEASAEFLAALPTVPPDPVPASVTRFQARAVMRRQVLEDGRTLLHAVEADLALAAQMTEALPATDPRRLAAEDALEAWGEAAVFERHSATMAQIAARFGFDDATIDEMFRAAAAVTA